MNSEFFEQMAMPLFDPLYNLAHWLTGDRSEAEDLVQEVGSSRVDLQACKLEYSIVSPK